MNTYSRKRSHLPDAPCADWHLPLLSPTALSNLSAATDSRHAITKDPQLVLPSSPINPLSSLCENRYHRSKKRIRLVQTTIDLRKDPRKICALCGMQYMLTSSADTKTHKKFCEEASQRLKGPEISQQELAGARIVRTCNTKVMTWGNTFADDHIMEVTRRSSMTMKAFAEKILEIAEIELGAVHISARHLWSTAPASPQEQHETQKKYQHDSFKVFLYVSQDRCVGLCLGQNIGKEARIMKPKTPDCDQFSEALALEREKSVELSSIYLTKPVAKKIMVGISRIWVVNLARRKGIAEDLLNACRAHFLLGRALSRNEIAFSQPTEAGRRLAQKWYGSPDRWHVYDDHNLAE